MRSAQLADKGGGNCRRSHSVILPEDSAGKGYIPHPVRRSAPATKTKTNTKTKKNLPMKGKTKRSTPSRWSGTSKVRSRKDLIRSLHELVPAR